MRYSPRKPKLWIVTGIFATSLTLLAPCAALGMNRDLDCELYLRFPMEALISPVIQEIGSVRPMKERNGGESSGWIDRRKSPPRIPIVRKRRPPPPTQTEEKRLQ